MPPPAAAFLSSILTFGVFMMFTIKKYREKKRCFYDVDALHLRCRPTILSVVCVYIVLCFSKKKLET